MDPNKTTAAELDIDIDSLLAQPGAETIILPADKKDEKPSIFSNKKVDISFLDKPAEDEPDNGAPDPEGKKNPEQAKVDAALMLDDIVKPGAENAEDGTDDQAKPKGGRPTAIAEVTQKLIDKGLIIPFEEDKTLDKYTAADFEELLETNFKERETKMQKEISTAFFDNLPEELQYAASYVANGGRDLKSLFKKLADVHEVYEADGKTEVGQEMVIRNYLTATNYGTPDEIQEQINEWKDQDLLEKKFSTFQPKLENLKQQEIDRTLKAQEANMKKYQAQTQAYMEDVYATLDTDALNGIKLDKKSQSMLYAGLINPTYVSRQGAKTNMLGHLLEKYQYVEPDHSRIAEVLWLLADPDGYKAKVRETTKKEVTADTVRKLKTEEANKNTSSSNGAGAADEGQRGTGKPATLKRPNNFFKR